MLAETVQSGGNAGRFAVDPHAGGEFDYSDRDGGGRAVPAVCGGRWSEE